MDGCSLMKAGVDCQPRLASPHFVGNSSKGELESALRTLDIFEYTIWKASAHFIASTCFFQCYFFRKEVTLHALDILLVSTLHRSPCRLFLLDLLNDFLLQIGE
jgi:hypothetical protein